MSFGITEDSRPVCYSRGFRSTAPWKVPVGNMATVNGLIVGTKKRSLVPRTVTLRNITCTVMFLLDHGAPVTYVCHRTLAEFGLSSKQLEAQSGNSVRGSLQGLGQTLYILDPEGPHHDLNSLGMDYLMKVDATNKIKGQNDEAELLTAR